MKKKVFDLGILMVVILLCACGKNAAESVPDATSDSLGEISTILAYINDYDGQTLTFDEVEWIVFPGERAEELALSDPGGGFLVYNETEDTEELPVVSHCIYTVLDWTNNYEAEEITSDELLSLLNERTDTSIPYTLTIQENQIISVTEHYVP